MTQLGLAYSAAMLEQMLLQFGAGDASVDHTEAQHLAVENCFPVAPNSPPLVRPDRQFTFHGLAVEEWPTVKHDDEAISVDRPNADIDGPAHRFLICCEDHVEVLTGDAGRMEQANIGTVLEIDHIRRRVLVTVVVDGKVSKEWIPVERVYPTTEQPRLCHCDG